MTLVTSDSAVAAYGVPVIYAGNAPRAPERRGERLIPVQTLTPIALPRAPPPDEDGAFASPPCKPPNRV